METKMDEAGFLREARATYTEINRKTFEWILSRPPLRGGFINTKQNPISLSDYDQNDGWRSPDILYGWIQGRGLEALVRHARFFADTEPDLSRRMMTTARSLYGALAELYMHERHAYFTYDAALQPVIPGSNGQPVLQTPAGEFYSYSDIFVVKGLLAASLRFDPAAAPGYLRDLAMIVEAVEKERFVVDERRSFEDGPHPHDAHEYGPRMILLSASELLRDCGFRDEAAYSDRLVAHIVKCHLDRNERARSYGLLRDRPDSDRCNPGHAIEFVGFALACDATRNDQALLASLDLIFKSSFAAGFLNHGLVLGLSAATLKPESDLCPWWSLPEAVRAAALLYRLTRDAETLVVWRRLHRAFLENYWRDHASLAYQMRDGAGPVDHAPATPDLDPGYHTGLSFLSTIAAIDDLLKLAKA